MKRREQSKIIEVNCCTHFSTDLFFSALQRMSKALQPG